MKEIKYHSMGWHDIGLWTSPVRRVRAEVPMEIDGAPGIASMVLLLPSERNDEIDQEVLRMAYRHFSTNRIYWSGEVPWVFPSLNVATCFRRKKAVEKAMEERAADHFSFRLPYGYAEWKMFGAMYDWREICEEMAAEISSS